MWVPFAASATVVTIGAVAKFVLPVVAIRPIPIPATTTTPPPQPPADVGVWYTFAPPITTDDGSASPHHRVSIPLSIFYPIDKTTPTTTTTTSSTSWLPHGNDIRYANGLASYASIPKFIFRRLRSHTMVATSTTAAGRDDDDDNDVAPYPVNLKTLAHDRVILFSHGLGGHRNMYSALCMSMAARGYVVIAMEHCEGSACCAVPLYTPFAPPVTSPTSATATNPLTVDANPPPTVNGGDDNHHHHHHKAYTMVPYMRPPVLEPHKKHKKKHTTTATTTSDDASAVSAATPLPAKTHAELQDASDLHFREKQLGERLTDVENIADAIRTKNLLGPLFGEKDAASNFATSASLQLVGHSFGGATVVGAAARATETFRNNKNNTSSSSPAAAKATVGGMPLLGFTALDVWLWPAKSLSDKVFINPSSSQSPSSPIFSPDSTTANPTASTDVPFSVQFIDSEQWERWSENRNAIKELVDTINKSSSYCTPPTEAPTTTDDTPAAVDDASDEVAVVPPPRAVRHYTPQTDHLAASDMALFLTLGVGRKKYVDCKKSSQVIGEWAGLVLSQK